ncbi:MAG TPA: bifunctional demethylmenaquinone methyltransferase/2-methoxy-6-polyprenyl-1,4-benzoquinol methylase UbiE [Acidobacteriaceae bacterium]|nr:bifunctional demethylmenaquinone methyltransferase/2-methoxy-6-polyprenyl-1,4-benzoquinol methylase UbiE [Acidobacteriaceae bacterium]
MNPETTKGAQPIGGAQDEAEAAEKVRAMFDSIAPKYDLLNHLLSGSMDRVWWWRAAKSFDAILKDPEARVLDLCCGTGDMTLALLKRRPIGGAKVIALDFSQPMLARGIAKFRAAGYAHAVEPIEADAMHLPLPDASIDLIVSAFGFRNLANYNEALRELHRVLKPGGQLGILEANKPCGGLGRIYLLYFERILPWIGRRISGDGSAYSYLPASVARFPQPPEMLGKMRNVGFSETRWTRYTFGVAGLYRATKK